MGKTAGQKALELGKTDNVGTEDLFTVHDFDVKIDLDVPVCKYYLWNKD